ncbi:hypothetical protein ACWDKQ_08675 [Saccharopolyspora sp. NPDC000995]
MVTLDQEPDKLEPTLASTLASRQIFSSSARSNPWRSWIRYSRPSSTNGARTSPTPRSASARSGSPHASLKDLTVLDRSEFYYDRDAVR